MNGKLIRPADRIDLGGTDWKMKEFVGMDWVWRDSVMPQTGDVRWWYPAEVPGSVLHDLMENGLVPDPYYEMNMLHGDLGVSYNISKNTPIAQLLTYP